jgi:hypothetical protein
MGVILTFGVLQPTLELQKCRRLGEKETKGAQGGIADGVSDVWPLFALGRQGRNPSVQGTLERIEAERGCHGYLLGPMEITTVPCRCQLATANPLHAKIRTADGIARPIDPLRVLSYNGELHRAIQPWHTDVYVPGRLLDVCVIHPLPVLAGFPWERRAPVWLLEPGWSPAFPGGRWRRIDGVGL